MVSRVHFRQGVPEDVSAAGCLVSSRGECGSGSNSKLRRQGGAGQAGRTRKSSEKKRWPVWLEVETRGRWGQGGKQALGAPHGVLT